MILVKQTEKKTTTTKKQKRAEAEERGGEHSFQQEHRRHAKSYVELNPIMQSDHTHSCLRNKRILCLITTLAVVIILVLIIVILAFTVFKAKRPIMTVDAITLDDIDVSLNLARLGVNLNVTLGVDLSVKNPNRVGFKYSDSTAYLNYRENMVGEAPLPADEISSGETKPVNLTLTVMADRLLSNASELFSDVRSGALPMNSFVRISGKVNIVNLFRVHVVSTSTCDFTVFLSNRTVSDRSCRYKTKL